MTAEEYCFTHSVGAGVQIVKEGINGSHFVRLSFPFYHDCRGTLIALLPVSVRASKLSAYVSESTEC